MCMIVILSSLPPVLQSALVTPADHAPSFTVFDHAARINHQLVALNLHLPALCSVH